LSIIYSAYGLIGFAYPEFGCYPLFSSGFSQQLKQNPLWTQMAPPHPEQVQRAFSLLMNFRAFVFIPQISQANTAIHAARRHELGCKFHRRFP